MFPLAREGSARRVKGLLELFMNELEEFYSSSSRSLGVSGWKRPQRNGALQPVLSAQRSGSLSVGVTIPCVKLVWLDA